MRRIRIIALILTFSLLFASCARKEPRMPAGFDYAATEPETVSAADGQRTVRFQRDDVRLYGKFLTPEGDGPFPVVVITGGLNAQGKWYEHYAEDFVDEGYAAVIYDPFGTGGESQSDGREEELTMFSETADLNTVIDSLSYFPEADTSEVYLWGHSFGGLVSAFVGCYRTDIKGLILVEPSFALGENKISILSDQPAVNIYNHMNRIAVDTLIVLGTRNSVADEAGYLDKTRKSLPSAKIINIDGADHYFRGEYGDMMMEEALRFLDGI